MIDLTFDSLTTASTQRITGADRRRYRCRLNPVNLIPSDCQLAGCGKRKASLPLLAFDRPRRRVTARRCLMLLNRLDFNML
jgi:hypothetical protein